MKKRLTIFTILLLAFFAAPFDGMTALADGYDEIADGEYELGVTAYEDGSDGETVSIADDFIHEPVLMVEDGNPSLKLKIGAGGGAFADFDFNINWFKVDDKEPTNERTEGDYTYYTFDLDSVESIIPASMEYAVPGFPGQIGTGHAVDFDLELSGLDDLPKKGYVNVTYVDQDGEEIADTVTLEGKRGDSYGSEQKDISGYEFVEVEGDSEGEFAEETANVKYVYEKLGQVEVTYVDQDGQEIADPEILEGAIGSEYNAEEKDVGGYKLVEVEGNETGEYTKETTTVEYVYKEIEEDPQDPQDPADSEQEQGQVEATYVDQDGNKLADPETLKGDLGDPYETKQKKIDGYDFVEVKGDETGKYTEEDTTVEYVYEKQVKENGKGKEENGKKEDTEENGKEVGNEDDDEENPQTGDKSNVLLYSLMLIGAGIPLAFIVKRRFV